MMLAHLGELEESKRLRKAIEDVYVEGKCLTPDVGGTGSTGEFTDAVVGKLA